MPISGPVCLIWGRMGYGRAGPSFPTFPWAITLWQHPAQGGLLLLCSDVRIRRGKKEIHMSYELATWLLYPFSESKILSDMGGKKAAEVVQWWQWVKADMGDYMNVLGSKIITSANSLSKETKDCMRRIFVGMLFLKLAWFAICQLVPNTWICYVDLFQRTAALALTWLNILKKRFLIKT